MKDIGFIFDLDGVITDTAEFHYLSWKRIAEEEGLPFTREDNEALRGVTRKRSLELLLKGRVYPEDKMNKMLEHKNTYYREFLSQVMPDHLLPGVSSLLLESKEIGIKLGLGSASRNAREVCERLEILHLLDAFGDGNTVVNSKPAPDLFVWVAGRMGLPPRQCVVFEDSEAGIEAALHGGFWSVGLGPHERVGKAHQVRTDLAATKPSDFLPPFDGSCT